MRRDWLGRANTEVIASVVGGVPDNPNEPCTELVGVATVVDALETTDESILTHVLRIEAIADASESHHICGAKVPAQQCFRG